MGYTEEMPLALHLQYRALLLGVDILRGELEKFVPTPLVQQGPGNVDTIHCGTNCNDTGGSFKLVLE